MLSREKGNIKTEAQLYNPWRKNFFSTARVQTHSITHTKQGLHIPSFLCHSVHPSSTCLSRSVVQWSCCSHHVPCAETVLWFQKVQSQADSQKTLLEPADLRGSYLFCKTQNTLRMEKQQILLKTLQGRGTSHRQLGQYVTT